MTIHRRGRKAIPVISDQTSLLTPPPKSVFNTEEDSCFFNVSIVLLCVTHTCYPMSYHDSQRIV